MDHTKTASEIIQVLENNFERDKFLRENSDALQKIGIFVLLIGKLEGRVKTILLVGGNKHILDMTFGRAIRELKGVLLNGKKEYDQNPRDYRHKNFLQAGNIERFISQCEELNKLRNDLIHNFVSPRSTGINSIEQILKQVEKMIAGANNWDFYRHGRISQEVLKGQKTTDDLVDYHLHIRTHDGYFRDDLPLDGLIEICSVYQDILCPKLLNIRFGTGKIGDTN